MSKTQVPCTPYRPPNGTGVLTPELQWQSRGQWTRNLRGVCAKLEKTPGRVRDTENYTYGGYAEGSWGGQGWDHAGDSLNHARYGDSRGMARLLTHACILNAMHGMVIPGDLQGYLVNHAQYMQCHARYDDSRGLTM